MEHLSLAPAERVPNFYTMRQQYEPGGRGQFFNHPPNQYQIYMAEDNGIYAAASTHHILYKEKFIYAITTEILCRKIQIIEGIPLFIIHATNLHHTVIPDAFFIQCFAHYPAYFLYATGGGEGAESEEESLQEG